jgi:hypothetical protein
MKFSADPIAAFYRMSCRNYSRGVLALIQTMIVVGFIVLLLTSMLPALLLARKRSPIPPVVTLVRSALPVIAQKA